MDINTSGIPTVFGAINVRFEMYSPSSGGLVSGRGDPGLPPYYFWSNLAWMHWGLSLALNVTITGLIVGRLWGRRSKIRTAFGAEYGRIYTGIVAILCESSLLYTLVITIGYFALPGPGGSNNMFNPLLAQSEVSENSYRHHRPRANIH